MTGRRPLRFDRLEDVMPEVERLLDGHEMAGRWSLGQVCRHLAVALRLSAASAARAAKAPPSDPSAREERRRAFAGGRDVVLRLGLIPEGAPTPSTALDPPSSLDDRAEADGLRAAIARIAQAPPCRAEHPALGPLEPDEWRRFHCVHCAHHLSFALPTVADGNAP